MDVLAFEDNKMSNLKKCVHMFGAERKETYRCVYVCEFESHINEKNTSTHKKL